MIVGAAAGYLTYQAGKAIIRSMAGPMMWNNRPYYWGSNYYRPQRGQENMCRMPLDPSDPQFGNIYQPDGVTRPHEIVWGCGYYEYCCGGIIVRTTGDPTIIDHSEDRRTCAECHSIRLIHNLETSTNR
ncbi:CX module [Teladorsagia circumcincta]|uniref:CX module n=1 Tax=Teladorsagia circumcincta TaxID=45464 RepID=A0A2G9TX18_TELCI|nr:CX module [Teladorsagia circumcincta]